MIRKNLRYISFYLSINKNIKHFYDKIDIVNLCDRYTIFCEYNLCYIRRRGKINMKILDKNYNESMFISRVNNIFIKLFTGIMFNNLDDVRHNISDVFEFAINIINENKNKNLRRMYDELNIKSTDINNISIDDNYYIIEVIITTRYLKYFINLDSGNYVSGDRNNRILEHYKLIFKKRRNTKEQKKCSILYKLC